MAQAKLNGGKKKFAVYCDGKQVAKLEYRKFRNPKTGKTTRVLSGPIKVLQSPS